MSDVPTNAELGDMEIFPGGVTFGKAAEIMGIPPSDTGTSGGKPTPPAPPASPAPPPPKTSEELEAEIKAAEKAADLEKGRSDAFSVLRTYLAKYKLEKLEGALKGVIYGGTVDLSSPNAILFALREDPAYVERFKANKERAKRNLAELDPATYIGMEDAYRELLQSSGFDKGFYDDQSDFENFIAGDVSAKELNERIESGFKLVRDADPGVKAQMKELYGVGDEQLAEFFLDQNRALPLLKNFEKTKKAKAAGIAARGFEQGGMQLTASEAEGLAGRGITSEEAADRFGARKQMAGLYDSMTGEDKLSREEDLGATFGFDTNALLALQGRQKKRVAQFQGGGQFSRTSGSTSGTSETGVGYAQ